MNYRLNQFFACKAYTEEQTEVIDLNMRDVISNIIIGLATLNVGDVNTEHPCRILKKIELVDGSDVLYSLNGLQADALDWYDQGGKFRCNWNRALTGQSMDRFVGINFGRYLWDREYALDPEKFSNLQLRITVDPDAGGNNPSTAYITCWANLFESTPVGIRGFLTSKEIKQYTMAATVHDYTDIPLDHSIRGLYFQPFVRGTESHQCISNLKLSEDQDKRIIFDHNINDIINAYADRYPSVVENYILPITIAGVYLYIAPSTHVVATGSRWEAVTTACSVNCYDGGGGKLYIFGSAAANAQVHVEGDVPHAVFEIPFGLKDDSSDWLDVRGLGSLKLDVTGSNTAEGHIFLQQERLY